MCISLSNRILALAVLVVFVFTGCPLFGPDTPDDRIVITPGEGTPRYMYLDDNGEFTLTDTGRTVMFIEDNKNAEGVFVVSDRHGTDSRVTIINENNSSSVSMYFRASSAFPYQMEIKIDNETYTGLLTNYRNATSTYDIIFQHEGEIDIFYDLVLNSAVFDIYERDNSLSNDENLRLQNITIALGLTASLSYYLDDAEISSRFINIKKIAKAFVGGVKTVFTATAVIATAVAVVVAPVVSLVNPAAGAILYNGAVVVYQISMAIAAGAAILEELLTDKPSTPTGPTNVIVRNHFENRPFINGEEYHIPLGSRVQLDFTIPGFNNNNLGQFVIIPYDYPFEPGVPQGPSNVQFFSFNRTTNGNSDEFQVIYRRVISGYIRNGKVAFGLMFDSDIAINGTTNNGIEFKLPTDENPILYRNMVVIRFCIDPFCSQYIP